MLVFLIVFFGILLGAGVALAAWARWLGARDGAPGFLKTLGLVFLAIPIMIIGIDVWALLAMRSAASGDDLDPATKARLLAEGISELMNGTALAAPLYLLGVLTMLALTWRYHWSAGSTAR